MYENHDITLPPPTTRKEKMNELKKNEKRKDKKRQTRKKLEEMK
jgi:hypothetical protein